MNYLISFVIQSFVIRSSKPYSSLYISSIELTTYELLALFSARGHSEAGLKLEDGVLEVTRHLPEFFILSKSSCLWSICVHYFSVATEKKQERC